MNNAFKDTQKHKESFMALQDAFLIFKSSGLSLSEYKRQAIEKSQKLSKKARDKTRIKISVFNGKDVFTDRFQIATHLHHKDITAFDYSLIGQILKGEVINKKENKTIIKKILGRKYFLVLKELNDGFYVSSLRFEH